MVKGNECGQRIIDFIRKKFKQELNFFSFYSKLKYESIDTILSFKKLFTP